ncbi:MAG: ABC transporter permease, partial [Erysipelotrichaceae bacterium]|nr:ABC transporter permease [Erysipelotrichaceae bacterium]
YEKLTYMVASARKQYDEGLEEYKEALITFNEEIEKADIEIRKAEQEIADLPNAKWTILDRDSHYSSYMYDGSCTQMQAIGYAMPVMFFLVAALVCLTTMKRLVDEQRGQIGIFVALGFSNRQIIGKYITYALLASLAGGIPGIILGQIIFPTVIYRTWRLMYYLPDMQMFFPLKYVLVCLLSFVVLMCSVTALVVNGVLKESPATLMRPKAPKNGSKILLEKLTFIWDRISFTSKVTARNLFRYKARFLMTVLGVAGCTGLLVIGWGIKDSISDVVSIQFSDIFNYNYQISLENSHNLDENIAVLNKNLGNDVVASYMTYTTKVYMEKDDDTAQAIVIDPRDAFLIFRLRDKKDHTEFRLSNEGIIVSNKFAINNGLKKGDMVTIESRNGLTAQVKISGICEMYFQHYVFISNSLYQNLFDETISNTTIAVKTDDHEALLEDCRQLEDFISVYDFSAMIDQFETMIKALNLIIAVIIVTAGSLAFVVLVNLTQVNISERVREIATIKVLGFNDHEINLYIFKEILLLTLIGGLCGLPLGVLEHHYIMNVINMEMIMFGMNIRFLSFLYAFLVTFVFTLIVLLFMRKPLRDVDMVESLKSVE